jgi:hypothetical protein
MKERYVCNDCVRRAGMTPKSPAESGGSSRLCECCGHFNIGSRMMCENDGWGHPKPVGHVAARAAGSHDGR